MNNKNNIMSIISKKISIDNRNKIITKPFVFENKTFEKFNSQYSVYENEVRFTDCTFDEEVVLGCELKDEAFSTFKTDLIFKNCIFKKKINLDGIQCKGHVIFDNCIFELSCPKGEDVLSISNAEIGIGVALYQCNLKGGVNLSCTNIGSLGCQFTDSCVINERSQITFSKSYFAKELSINGCFIKCRTINFENIALSDNQGALLIGGNFQYFIHTNDIICELINSKYNTNLNSDDHSYNLVNFYERIDNNGVNLLIQQIYEDIDTSLIKSLLFLIKQYINDKKYNSIKLVKNEAELDGAYPCGNGTINIIENEVLIISVYIDGCFYLKNLKVEDDYIVKCELSEYSDAVFKKVKESYLQLYKETNFKEELCFYNNIRMLALSTDRDDQYIAIYDSNQGFKVYKWNYIQTSSFNLHSAYVGQGLFFRQSEINTPKIDLTRITAQKTIEFEDCKLYCDVNARGIELIDITFNNVVFESYRQGHEDFETFLNPENERYRDNEIINGIDLSYSRIKNKLSINDICIVENRNNNNVFNIYLSFSSIGALLELCMIGTRQNDTQKVRLYLASSNINQIVNYMMRWEHIILNVDNSKINHFKTINSMLSYVESDLNFKKIKKIVSSIDDGGGKGTGRVLFLKQMESTFLKDDKYDDFEKTWKFRNKIRIKKKWKYFSFIPLTWNYMVVNYGLSTWRLALWLVLIMISFDLLVFFKFVDNVSFCLVNGCIEFIPVSFNTPILEGQLRSNAIKEVLKSFEYSAIVTAYKIISYILVSVLIASFTGFFRNRNE